MVEYNTIFYKNSATLHVCVHGHRKDFFHGGALVSFSIGFSSVGGPKVVKFVFYHSKLRKQPFY